jgi:hypothetical protein
MSSPSTVRTTPANGIKARRTRFDLSTTPLHWVPGDPQSTHLMDVLHIVLPPGERWFCDVFREALPHITDERLREDVKGFMGQEATHARAHELGRDHLGAHGIDTGRAMDQAEWLRKRLGGKAPLGLTLPMPLARWWLVTRLSSIAAIEHFTAVLGYWILDSGTLDTVGADPQMMDLLRWHGAEEVEHRAVAFDVFEHISGSYPRRVVSMLLVALALNLAFLIGGIRLMSADPTTDQGFSLRRWSRSAQEGRIPPPSFIWKALPRYLRRDYHPSQVGSSAAAIAYLMSSPGVLPPSRPN